MNVQFARIWIVLTRVETQFLFENELTTLRSRHFCAPKSKLNSDVTQTEIGFLRNVHRYR